ncbi:MAG: CPBP family intramembrane metalloprotease [Anaerolineae bacterium]|nr:CPBP family intramembrane metalloprotease [Anaerolineae bacterium]
MKTIPLTVLLLLFNFVLVITLWIYFFIHSYRRKIPLPWGFGIVIAGILLSGTGIPVYHNHVVVFFITLPFAVGLVGTVWNINDIKNQLHVRGIGEFLRFVGIGLTYGLLFGFIIVIAQVPKYVEVPAQYTITALIAIGIQASIAEELLFRGYFLGYLRKYELNRISVIVIQALIFAIFHVPLYLGNWIALSIIFLIGVTAGDLTWKSNNLIPAFVLHIVLNLIAVIWRLAVA